MFGRAAILTALVLTGCDQARAEDAPPGAEAEPRSVTAPPRSRQTRVETATLEPSTAALRVTVPGEVEAARDAQLAAPMGGFIERVSVKVGQAVEKGEALVFVDTATHIARKNQALVDLKAAEVELARARKLGDSIPGQELDAREYDVARAKAALRVARVAASRTIVRAPFSGTVVSVDAERGEVAPAGAPLVRVVTLDPMEVSVSLSDRDVVALKPGMPAKVVLDARSGSIDGKLVRIAKAADLDTRAFEAVVEVPNPNHQLLPGMIATVSLGRSVSEGKIVISQDWLVTGIDKVGVYVNAKGVARWRDVKLGPVVRNQVIVEQGLSGGDEVVVTGHRELSDGDRLLVSRSGKCCTDGRVVWK